MYQRSGIIIAAVLLTACSTVSTDRQPAPPANAARTASPAVSSASSTDAYKRDIARQITALHQQQVYAEQPQALLRAVIVLRYAIDADGKLIKAEILRSNKDQFAEKTALASLRNSAPFPVPQAKLLRGGKLEASETWLFNDDGRFQIRSIALPQRGE